MNSYSGISKAILQNIEREKDLDKYAVISHYLHNYSWPEAVNYEKDARQYMDELRIDIKDPSVLIWDVPYPPVQNPEFTFIDLFAGIGGMRLAFRERGGKCVFSSELDKFAVKTYEANFGEVPFGDIKVISEDLIPDHDILLAGFPCQPFSISGVSKKNSLKKKHGFLCEAQGTLFFDIARIIESKRPRAFLLENVKNLKSHDRGKTYKKIMEVLDMLDYEVFDKVLDGKYYVPQHRERIFIAGFDRKRYGDDVDFSFTNIKDTQELRVKDILEADVDSKYTLSDHLWSYLQDYAKKHKAKGNGFGYGLVDLNGITRTLSARYYKDGSEILIPQGDENINPRRLTPRECARLQGFPDDFQIVVSDTQAYKQFGNAVVVPLISSIAGQISKKLKELERQTNDVLGTVAG